MKRITLIALIALGLTMLAGCAAHQIEGQLISGGSYSPFSLVEMQQDDAGKNIAMALSGDFAADSVVFDPATGTYTATMVTIMRTPQVALLPDVITAEAERAKAIMDGLSKIVPD